MPDFGSTSPSGGEINPYDKCLVVTYDSEGMFTSAGINGEVCRQMVLGVMDRESIATGSQFDKETSQSDLRGESRDAPG